MWLSVSRPRAARLNGEHEPHTMGELAGVAQLAAHFTCNEGVRGSSPLAGSDVGAGQRHFLASEALSGSAPQSPFSHETLTVSLTEPRTAPADAMPSGVAWTYWRNVNAGSA